MTKNLRQPALNIGIVLVCLVLASLLVFMLSRSN